MNSLEVERLDDEIGTPARFDDGSSPVARPSLLRRFYNWLLDEIAPPADEPFDDWADRQW
jgi:hypothetical protein